MDYNELNDNAGFIGNTNFSMKVNSLHAQMVKCIERCENEIDDLYDNGFATSKEGKAKVDMLEDMVSCYETLHAIKIITPQELAEVEWLFNKGELRSKEEIQTFCDAIERKFVKPKENKASRYRSLEDRVMGIMHILPFIVASSLGGIPFLLDSETIETAVFAAVIITILAYMPCFLIFRGIGLAIEVKVEDEVYKYSKKNNIEYKPSAKVLLDAAVYGVALGVSLKGRKRR